VIETTLNGLVEGRATGLTVALVVVDWPTVLLSNAIDLHQTVGLPIEEMTAATREETKWIPTFHLQVLEPIEIEVDHLEVTAGGHVVQ
jgi:hypothetical protein